MGGTRTVIAGEHRSVLIERQTLLDIMDNDSLVWTVFQISQDNDTISCDSTFTLFAPLSAPEAPLEPSTFNLEPPFPNPFNSRTTITFGLGKPAPTRLSIYDLSGRLVTDLLDRQGRLSYDAGEHKVVWNAGDLGAGVYLVKLEAGGRSVIQKTVIIR